MGGNGAKAIQFMANLTTLNLRNNNIRGHGIKSIAAILPDTQNLVTLDLRGNYIEDNEVEIINKAL